MSFDPNFSNVKLLVHFDGTNGQSDADAFADFSSVGHVPTNFAAGKPALDTTNPQWGTASGSFGVSGPGNGRVTYQPVSNDFNFSGDLTLEGWVRKPVATTGGLPNGEAFSLANSSLQQGFRVTFDSDAVSTAFFTANVSFQNVVFPSFNSYSITAPSGAAGHISTGVWHHWAVVAFGTSLTFYIDGNSYGAPVTMSSSAIWSGVNALIATFGKNEPSGQFYSGWSDDIRYTNGIARYTSNFTPPTEAFPNSGVPDGASVYGKFLTSGLAYPPIQSANLGAAKPRFYEPFLNTTIKVPK